MHIGHDMKRWWTRNWNFTFSKSRGIPWTAEVVLFNF